MSLNTFMSSIAEEFSGKEFTTQELMDFITSSGSDSDDEPKKGKNGKKVKKVKKEPEEKKKVKMTIRKYFMTEETDVYKVQITSRKEANKEWNVDHSGEIEAGDVEKKTDNFLSVMKLIMDELGDEELEELKEKVALYPKFSEVMEANKEWNIKNSEEIESGELIKRSVNPIEISKEKSQTEDSDSD
jgi:hypothetical protein